MIAAVFYSTALAGGPMKNAEPAILASNLTDEDITVGLAAVYDESAEPFGTRVRTLYSVNPRRPIIQVNCPITKVSESSHGRYRQQARLVQRTLEQGTAVQVELTCDYVAPNSLYVDVTDEHSVLAAMYRASAMIFFVDDGAVGTGRALQLAASLLIPVLTLTENSNGILAARFPGHLDHRYDKVFDSNESLRAAVDDFMRSAATMIAQRNHYLGRLVDVDISHMRQRLDSVDRGTFANSPLRYERARFYLESPLHYFQASGAAHSELSRVLQIPKMTLGQAVPATTSASSFRREVAPATLRHSFLNLLRAADKNGWSPARMRELEAAQSSMGSSAAGVSPRAETAPLDVRDWESLDRATPSRAGE